MNSKDFVVAIDFGTYGTSFAIGHKGSFVGAFPRRGGHEKSKPYLKYETKLLYEADNPVPIKWVCYTYPDSQTHVSILGTRRY